MAIYIQVDPDTRLMTQRLQASPIYIKTAVVEAVQLTAEGLRGDQYRDLDVRRTDKGDFVVDIYVMSDTSGKRMPTLEASQPVRAGDWIITNPLQQAGDRANHYGKSDQSFRERYLATATPGVYQAIGLIRAVKNPAHTNIQITAYWGKTQYGDPNCYICAPVNRENLEDLAIGKRYLISANDFATTYVPVEELLGPDWRDKI